MLPSIRHFMRFIGCDEKFDSHGFRIKVRCDEKYTSKVTDF